MNSYVMLCLHHIDSGLECPHLLGALWWLPTHNACTRCFSPHLQKTHWDMPGCLPGCLDAYRLNRDAYRDAEPQEPAAAAAAALSRQLPRRPSRPRTCEKAVSGGLLFVSGGVVSGIWAVGIYWYVWWAGHSFWVHNKRYNQEQEVFSGPIQTIETTETN